MNSTQLIALFTLDVSVTMTSIITDSGELNNSLMFWIIICTTYGLRSFYLCHCCKIHRSE